MVVQTGIINERVLMTVNGIIEEGIVIIHSERQNLIISAAAWRRPWRGARALAAAAPWACLSGRRARGGRRGGTQAAMSTTTAANSN